MPVNIQIPTTLSGDVPLVAAVDGNPANPNTGIAISRPYKSYVVKLNQDGTNPPVPVIFENSLDEVPTYSYISPGDYRMVFQTPFDPAKVMILYPNPVGGNLPDFFFSCFVENNHNSDLRILMQQLINAERADDSIHEQPLEIRFYS